MARFKEGAVRCDFGQSKSKFLRNIFKVSGFILSLFIFLIHDSLMFQFEKFRMATKTHMPSSSSSVQRKLGLLQCPSVRRNGRNLRCLLATFRPRFRPHVLQCVLPSRLIRCRFRHLFGRHDGSQRYCA